VRSGHRRTTGEAAGRTSPAAFVVLVVVMAPWLGGPVAAQEAAPPDTALVASLPTNLPSASLLGANRVRWNYTLSLALDSFVHSYPLAVEDTTEIVNELNFGVSVEGQSPIWTRHRWYLRGDLFAGSELYRQRLEARYAWRPDGRLDRLRLDVDYLGRQYLRPTSYSLNSDNREIAGEVRVVPLAGRNWLTDLRAKGWVVDYRTPSTLEQDRREVQVAAFLRAPPTAATIWGVGVRRAHRAYPDTAEIDRDMIVLEADLTRLTAGSEGLVAFHRSERRNIADESVRPSAWSHWSHLQTGLPAGTGALVLEVESEKWNYDYETGAYFDSWRYGGYGGFRIGDMLTSAWQFGIAAERFDAGTQPESFDQLGARVGLESYGGPVSGGIILEYGRRSYWTTAETSSTGDSDFDADLADVFAYTDFNYWEIWLVGTWRMIEHFSIDVLASYRPEKHSEPTDDAALGFASLRLVWRP